MNEYEEILDDLTRKEEKEVRVKQSLLQQIWHFRGRQLAYNSYNNYAGTKREGMRRFVLSD